MKKVGDTVWFLMIICSVFIVGSCESSPPTIDDERIIGGWHLKQIIENGSSQTPADSTMYIFSKEGVMQIRAYAQQSASPLDQTYTYSLENGILHYWNYDINVVEEKSINISGSSLTINIDGNTKYQFNQLF